MDGRIFWSFSVGVGAVVVDLYGTALYLYDKMSAVV